MCRVLAPGPSDQSSQCETAVKTPPLTGHVQKGCIQRLNSRCWQWTRCRDAAPGTAIWKGRFALPQGGLPSFSSSALCLGECQSPACLPLGGLVAPNLCNISLPIRGIGHSGIYKKEWVSVCSSNLHSNGSTNARSWAFPDTP